MAKLDVSDFSDEFKEVVPKECAIYLYSCLDKETQKKVKDDWNKNGGYKAIPWWKWCLDNISVSYNK